MNRRTQILVRDNGFISLGYVPTGESLDRMVGLLLIFLETSIVGAPIYIPTNNAQGSLFSTSSPTLVISCLFNDRQTSRSEVITTQLLKDFYLHQYMPNMVPLTHPCHGKETSQDYTGAFDHCAYCHPSLWERETSLACPVRGEVPSVNYPGKSRA